MYMQLAALGRWISVVITLGLYFSGWTIAASYFKGANEETWVRIFTIIWAIIHIVMLILWIVWSWAVV